MQRDEFQLLLRFTGLCAFVPNKDVDATEATVLMPETRMRGRQAHGGHAGQMEPHCPVLVAYADSFLSPGTGPDIEFKSRRGEMMGLVFLEDLDVKIKRVEDSRLHMVGQGDEVRDAGHESVAWVAAIRDLYSGSAKGYEKGGVVEQCLNSKAPPTLAARVKLAAGRLTNSSFAVDSEGQIVAWAFLRNEDDSPMAEPRPISEELQLTCRAKEQYVEFILNGDIHRRRAERDRQFSVCLKPCGSRLEAWIANIPLRQSLERNYQDHGAGARALERMGFDSPGDPGDRDADHHFAQFYSLVRAGRSYRIPHPVGRKKTVGGPSNEAPKCPPLIMDSNPRA